MDGVVVAAALWGAASGLAAAVVPWRRWAGDPDGPAGGAASRAGAVALGVAGAVAGAALAQRGPGRPESAVWLLLLPAALLLARTDLTARRLPDVLTLPAAGGTAVLLGAAALLPGHAGSWPRALLGGVVLGAVYFALMLAKPDGMGFGDVKLAPTLGLALAWYGWRVLFYGTFLAFVLGAAAGLVLLAARRAGRRTALPFGPFMLLGALGALLWAGG